MAKKINQKDLLLNSIIESIDELKGLDTISLDFDKIDNRICSYFIICSGTSNTHVRAISGNIKKNILKKINEKPFKVEGESASEWVLMDYSNIVIHIFQKETREFYKLEELWGDAKITKYN